MSVTLQGIIVHSLLIQCYLKFTRYLFLKFTDFWFEYGQFAEVGSINNVEKIFEVYWKKEPQRKFCSENTRFELKVFCIVRFIAESADWMFSIRVFSIAKDYSENFLMMFNHFYNNLGNQHSDDHQILNCLLIVSDVVVDERN